MTAGRRRRPVKPKRRLLRCVAAGGGEREGEGEEMEGNMSEERKEAQPLRVCLFSCSAPQPEA